MLSEVLFNIPDFRRGQGKMYDLPSVLHMSILGILSNATSYRQIHIFINAQFSKLKKTFGLLWKRVPSYSSIRRIICWVSSSDLEISFRTDANEREYKISYEGDLFVLSFDGKVLKGSFDDFKDVKSIQILSIFSKKSKLILAHEQIAEKTNEIPVSQALIPKLGFKVAIFTADALSCQKKTANVIVESGNSFVVQVKKNQKALLNACQLTSEISEPIDEYTEPFEKGHGRIEARKASVFMINSAEMPSDEWDKFTRFIKVERFREDFDTKTKKYKKKPEVSFYCATNKLTAQEYNEVIRGHWGIENSNHYVRDVSMKEDASRIRINPQNIMRLKSYALNILRDSGVTNIAARLFENSVNIKELFKLNIW